MKGVNPNWLSSRIKYVNDVSYVDHLSSVNCITNVSAVAPDLPVGARLHQCWEKWAALGVSPKVLTVLREGYTLPFRFQPNLTRSPTIISCYVNPHWNLYLVEALHQLLNKYAVELIPIGHHLGVLQQTLSGSKTQQIYSRPQYPEEVFKDRVIQNGDTRDNKNLPTGRGVGCLHRFQRRILPNTDSKTVHAFSCPG